MFEIASHTYTVCWQLELVAAVCPYACTHLLFQFLHTTTLSSPQKMFRLAMFILRKIPVM
jgi:hypothetical protein